MAIANVIPAQKQLLVHEDSHPHNVCAYCRVSTDENDQRNSLVSQQRFFENYFRAHDNWNVIDIFADEGLSGTSLERRTQFNKMIMLAKAGVIDLILTKEVSRFSRNVLDLLKTVEELRSLGVYVWFLSDDIHTQSTDYREQLTQIATNAEQESLRTSRRVKWGQMQQMETGIVFGRRRMFGYQIERDDVRGQKFIVIPDEAKIVKDIYRWFCAGDSASVIARRLSQQQTLQYYKNGWNTKTVLRILQNEKYTGDLLQGKTWTPDPLSHKKKYNNGQSNRYQILEHHVDSAIIERSLWNQAQTILHNQNVIDNQKHLNRGRYWLSGKLICGYCGSRYICIRKKQKKGLYLAWLCGKKDCKGSRECSKSKRIQDKILRFIIHDLLTHLLSQTKKEKELYPILMRLNCDERIAELCSRLIDHITVIGNNDLQIRFLFSAKPIYLQYNTQGRGDTTQVFVQILEQKRKPPNA